MTTEESVRGLVAPIAADLGLSIYDIEVAGGTVRVLLDRDGGIDLGAITEATRRISRGLDDADPISGSYMLEVSSPGIERDLRIPEHFSGALGERIKVKTRADSGLDRRLQGALVASDSTSLVVESDAGERVQVRFDQIERARTAFVETAKPKPGKGPSSRKRASGSRSTENAPDLENPNPVSNSRSETS